MANLKQAGTKRLAQLGRRPDLPPWWQALSYVLLVGFFIYLGVSALSPRPFAPPPSSSLAGPAPAPQPPTVPPAQDAAPVPGGAADQDPTEPPADAQPDPTTVDPTQTPGDIAVATVQGGSASVPAAAHAVARDAALALFTGEFERVPRAAAATFPTGLPTYADPAVGATVLELAESERFVFSTVIDPDRSGPEAPRPVTVAVTLEGGVWRFAGFGF
jgi:hypothetical protein